MWKFLLLLACITSQVYCQNSPVFLWGSSSPLKPTLKSLTEVDFSEIIEPKLHDSMILAFLEKDLETQDFSQCKKENGESCFANLKTFQSKTFYADVEDAVKALKGIAIKKEFVTINSDGEMSKDISYEVRKVVFVSFQNVVGERSNVLTDHDSAIGEIFGKFENKGKIFALYTSEETIQSSHRVRRQATTQAPPVSHYKEKIDKNGFSIYFARLMVKEGGSDAADITITGMKLSNNSDKGFDVELQSASKNLKFRIVESNGYWVATDVQLGGEHFSSSVEAAIDFSYYCGNVVFSNEKETIIWEQLQMQPYFQQEPTKFNDPWHCVGFTSAAIWSGLFVTFMLIFIMSVGITCMMDINTMDRFDDPKGKTITINASD